MRLVPLLLVVAACSSTPSEPQGERIGEPLQTTESVRYSVVGADPAAHVDETVLVEASVVAVCQSAGCWMQVEDGGRTALVRWSTGCGGKYAFPKDLAGKRVLIQGSFHPKATGADEVEHLSIEAGRELEIPAAGYELNASAIVVLP
jgi:hypothetical protein